MRSKALLAANILATIYAVYLFSYFGNSILNSDGTAAIGGAIATVLVAPHMFSFLAGAVFGWVGYGMRKTWGALTAAILYTVGTIMFLTYFMFGAPILILGFIGYACQKKCNAEYELEQLEQAESARIYAEAGLPAGIVTSEDLTTGKQTYSGKLNYEEVQREYNAVKRKKKETVWIILSVAVVVIFWGAIGMLSDDDTSTASTTTNKTTSSTTNKTTTSSSTANKSTSTSNTANKTTTTTKSKTETKKEPETIVFEAEFTDGNYICGIHFPAGKYDVTAIDGSGYVRSSDFWDGGISAAMGVDDDDISEFKNAKFEEDTILQVEYGIKIKIRSEKADSTPLKVLNQPGLETVTLSSGNYVAGEDFPTGVYDVIATAGRGNVSSDNISDGGINALMSGETEKSDTYISEYKNVILSDGMEFSVNGLTVDLVPSK